MNSSPQSAVLEQMSEQRTQQTIIVRPETTFARIHGALVQLGWTRAADTSVAPPIIPGEPELASWSRANHNSDEKLSRISYTFNPVVYLRVLVFYGDGANARRAEVERELPTLDSAELRKLLRSVEPREVLLGIFAARELEDTTLLDVLPPLRNHPEPAVARAAQKASEELVQLTLELGAERLREEKERHPERSVLFPRLGDAHLRRQTLRWLIHDFRESNQHIDEVLRSALVDEDWEVRASAMLAAARLGATAVGPDVARMALPPAGSLGLDETDRSILYAAHKLALAHLAGRSIKDADAPNDDHALFQDHLWQCMTGRTVHRYDRIFLFIKALTEPLAIADDDPST